jgi:hypothetical protein
MLLITAFASAFAGERSVFCAPTTLSVLGRGSLLEHVAIINSTTCFQASAMRDNSSTPMPPRSGVVCQSAFLMRMTLYAIITNTTSITLLTIALEDILPGLHQLMENAAKKKTMLTKLNQGICSLYEKLTPR